MKWLLWIIVTLLLYVLSIGPVAYVRMRSELGPGYVRGSSFPNECTGYLFWQGTAGASFFSGLPTWLQTFYAPLKSLTSGRSAPGRWINDYTTWWVCLAY